MMKFLLFSVVVVVLSSPVNTRAEDHQGDASSTGQRSISQPKPQSKIFEYISACLAGRPVGPSGINTGSLSLGAPGSGGGSGEAIFRSKCLRCHSGASGPPNLTLLDSISAQKSIVEVNSGNMPREGSLSAEEKSALLQYLQSKR
ncbi:MAG: cytochrome c [Deltaproteobacteria bacterium]|nr:cytochrome c [Deltaproteobacteria bacterium]